MDKKTYTPAQKALIEKHRDINVEGDDWHDWTLNDFIEVAAAFGFSLSRTSVQYSGFWSQGDGASFIFGGHSAFALIEAGQVVANEKPYGEPEAYTSYVKAFHDLWVYLTEQFAPWVYVQPEGKAVAEDFWIVAQRISHHYSHSNTVSVSVELGNILDDVVDKCVGMKAKISDIEKPIDQHIKAIADSLYKALEEEHDYQTSDEQVWGAIVSNGMDLDAA